MNTGVDPCVWMQEGLRLSPLIERRKCITYSLYITYKVTVCRPNTEQCILSYLSVRIAQRDLIDSLIIRPSSVFKIHPTPEKTNEITGLISVKRFSVLHRAIEKTNVIKPIISIEQTCAANRRGT